ncbi:MAG: hypothetical protein K2N87_09695 [Eubacterium sp.]|nr:hypothetical protein [Eubacterium sp.]
MHSHEELEYTKICFIRKSDKKELSITLYSHYSCIMGDSGIGKTCFFETIAENEVTNEIEVQSDYPIITATVGNLNGILDIPQRRIVFIDESNVFGQQQELMEKINASQHLFVCIGRAFTCNGDYPLQGIYTVHIDGDWFSIKRAEELNVTRQFSRRQTIITESSPNRSEHEVLKPYFEHFICAGGRNRIQAKLLRVKSGIVFADLGNIGRAYHMLLKRIRNNADIYFYDYQSFEQLLYDSPLLEQCRLAGTKSNFDEITVERYYSALLEECTSCCKELKYVHGKPLACGYSCASAKELFESKTGQGILDAVLEESIC